MKLRPLALLALLVVTSAMPLVAAAAACEAMPMCHRGKGGESLVAPMPCCGTEMSCAPEPAAQPEATAFDGARVAVVVAAAGDAAEALAPRPPRPSEPPETSPPPPTRVRLARLATLLI